MTEKGTVKDLKGTLVVDEKAALLERLSEQDKIVDSPEETEESDAWFWFEYIFED